MSATPHETDIAIIGAGPVGLFAVHQCGMLRLRCHVIDTLEMVGGQCAALYPEKPIYDIPAYPEIRADALIEALSAQAAPFRPVYHLGQQVVALAPQPDGGFRLRTSSGAEILCRGVILAAGVGAFGPNRPPLEGLEAYEGRSVFYLVRRRADFAGRRVVIAGGGDSAVDWAISLSEVAASLTLLHRRPKFRAAPESVARLDALVAEGRVTLAVPYQLAGLEGEDGALSGVVIEDLEGARRTLPADALLPFYGLAMELGPIAEWGLGLERNHIAVDPTTLATNLPGVHAIGDIATYPHKLKLILCGFSEAALAAHALRRRLFPDEVVHFEYSTTKGVPAL